MVNVSLNALVGKLTPTVHDALEQSAWLCRSMTHFDIELEHLFLKLIESEDNDIAKILAGFGADPSRVVQELTNASEKLRRGNTRDTPGISPRIPELFEKAWLFGSVEQGAGGIRSGHLLYTLLADSDFYSLARSMSREWAKIDTEVLADNFAKLVESSSEAREAPSAAAGAPGAPPSPSGAPGGPGGKALDQFTIDLTAKAKAGDVDPVLGRDDEIRLMIDILMRRRQNNPILTGEPGVGKTAVVEGFAQRLASGDVPDVLKKTVVRTLDLGLLQAGAGVRGEFENRLKDVIEEVKGSPVPIILFIDEAHTMIGAGGSEGGSDAANLLKPALARGELRTIAATTWAEYKKYFEKDAALARRFQVVKVEEPSVETAMVMLRGIAGVMEKHHKVKVLPGAIEAAVKLSDRYLSDRNLPDKAVSILDTASARVALGQAATPAQVEAIQRHLDDLAVEQRILKREAAVGGDHAERLAAIEEDLRKSQDDHATFTARWEKEKALVNRIVAARSTLDPAREGEDAPDEEAKKAAVADLHAAEEELTELQGEDALMRACVDEQASADVIANWTGIPVGRMVSDEIEMLLSLEKHLGERVVGQDHALAAIAQRVRTSRANIADPKQPRGVFLLVGPSGVGKTETALTLAEMLYGGEKNVISINMSEYQEAHTVSSLKGSPPGYVGYGEGGVLTEAVRRRPYSVVLLDETEKAHPDVMELFYQVFDKGTLEDGEGRV
ncbi:MAG: type VI secretion system ATPase TssH, partial [Planctomycetota bacterium]